MDTKINVLSHARERRNTEIGMADFYFFSKSNIVLRDLTNTPLAKSSPPPALL
jgi:hypothetical protein